MGDALVIRHHKTDTALMVIAAHHLVSVAFQDFNQSAFAPPTPVDSGQTGHDAVIVDHRAHLARRQKQVVTAIIRHQKAETVGVGDDVPAYQLHLADQAVTVLAIANHLAVALHGTQAPAQGIEIDVLIQLQNPRQLLF